MSAIGILGGMGPQASARLYELLIEGTKSYTPAAVDDDYPEIILLNVPVPNFISNKKEVSKAKQMLIERTKLLEQAGCVINGIACNTAHILLPELQAVTSVPFLSIPKLVAERISASGFERVGLFATPTTLDSSLYDQALDKGVTLVCPNKDVSNKIESYIYKQLNSSLTVEQRATFRNLVANFMDSDQLDAVILGCTELPLVYGKVDDERILSTLEVLSTALLKVYFKQKPLN